MHPEVLRAMAAERTAELRAGAVRSRRANAAANRCANRRTGRLSRLSAGDRSHRVELTWPDGVRSVVSVPQQAAGDEQTLTAERR